WQNRGLGGVAYTMLRQEFLSGRSSRKLTCRDWRPRCTRVTKPDKVHPRPCWITPLLRQRLDEDLCQFVDRAAIQRLVYRQHEFTGVGARGAKVHAAIAQCRLILCPINISYVQLDDVRAVWDPLHAKARVLLKLSQKRLGRCDRLLVALREPLQ